MNTFLPGQGLILSNRPETEEPPSHSLVPDSASSDAGPIAAIPSERPSFFLEPVAPGHQDPVCLPGAFLISIRHFPQLVVTLLTFSDVTVQFGADPLLTGVSFHVGAGERWGIVGRNGSGKTTILRLIRGSLEPRYGTVARRSGLRVTMLDQYREFGEAGTVWEAAAAGFEDLLYLEHVLGEESERLGALGSQVSEADLRRYDRTLERFHHLGGYSFHAQVDAVLQGMGFDALAARSQPLHELSGGERGRVGLAAQIAAPADLILLDEPTNHLDLDTIDWLRRHLQESEKTVMVVSHDRAFLDDFADHVLHLSHGSATPYRGGYSSFVQQRDQALLTLQRKADEQRKEIARQEEFIRRNIAGQNTAQARSRRTRLARLPRLSPPPEEDEAMAVRFELSSRGGDQVLVAEDVIVRVGARTLVDRFSAVARRGEVIALVGPNGSGKTTLLATILGERPPSAGSLRLGAGITAAWYRQDHTHLPLGRAIYDCIAEAQPTWGRGRIQDHLGRFGFSGEEVQRSTDSLSGGERSRVALALLTVQGSNLLVLDEPTNHLDVESIEALEDALENYPGTVILVSHDRALLRELTTRVWAFQADGIQDYPGPFVEWESRAAEAERQRLERRMEADRWARAQDKVQLRKAMDAQREKSAPVRAARKSVEHQEGLVTGAEEAVARLQADLARPELYDGTPGRLRQVEQLNSDLREARAALDDALAGWSKAVELLEELEGKGGPSG